MSSVLEAELLVHLDTQLSSARRLLGLVLDQGKAIRKRDVDAVLGKLAEVQTEMGRRGALEASNTDMSEAMVAMIESQRAYQLVSKAISTADEMMGIANQVKR